MSCEPDAHPIFTRESLTLGNLRATGSSRAFPSVMVIIPCPGPLQSRVTTPLTPAAIGHSTCKVPCTAIHQHEMWRPLEVDATHGNASKVFRQGSRNTIRLRLAAKANDSCIESSSTAWTGTGGHRGGKECVADASRYSSQLLVASDDHRAIQESPPKGLSRRHSSRNMHPPSFRQVVSCVC